MTVLLHFLLLLLIRVQRSERVNVSAAGSQRPCPAAGVTS